MYFGLFPGYTGNMEEQYTAVHFVGFRGDEYWSAVRVWGKPDFFHRTWDHRAAYGGEIAPWDVVVFARGSAADQPCPYSFNDSDVDVIAYEQQTRCQVHGE